VAIIAEKTNIKRLQRKEEEMKYSRILLAYNGSQEGKRALFEAADLAAFLGAETHLLAVASMPPSLFLTEGFVPEELLEEEKKRTQSVLDEGIRTLRERGFNAIGHLAVGEPVEEICRLAKSLSVNLIVLGHNQNTSFAARWWKGSVGASLLDYAPCSILIALSKV
jgi:nucleotide-binding universal stress UspA family protein